MLRFISWMMSSIIWIFLCSKTGAEAPVLLFTIRSFIDVGFNAGVFDAGETFQDGFKYDFRPSTWNSHADLFSDAFFTPDKFIGIGKGLQAGAFPVCQGPGFFPVVNMGSAATASGDGICRFVRV